MRRNLYLHEVVDIVGQGQYDYMEHLWKDPVLRMPEMFGLQGSFYVCAAGGGRWPQVVNIWDVGNQGWDGWAANVDRMNLKRRKAFYGDWWDEAAKWRTGGFDRLCGGLVPPVPVERLAALQVHAVDVGRPSVPSLIADVPDVDHLRPPTAAGGTDVERPLQAEHLGHADDWVLPQVFHVVVLALPDDVDDLVQVQVAPHPLKGAAASPTRSSAALGSTGASRPVPCEPAGRLTRSSW